MKRILFTPILLGILFLGNPAKAATPSFENLSTAQVNSILKEFSAAMFPSAVTAAGSYGKIFGFEIGVIGGISDSPEMNKLVTENVDKLPHAGVLASASFLFGLGVELVMLPVKVGGFEYDYYSIGGKWTFTDAFDILPLDLRLRVKKTTAKLKWDSTVSSVPTQIEYENDSLAYDLTIGKKILIVEPYAGIGQITSENGIKANGSVSIFDVSVPLTATQNVEFDDTYYFFGANIHLLIFTIGAEMVKVFDNDIITGKLAIGF